MKRLLMLLPLIFLLGCSEKKVEYQAYNCVSGIGETECQNGPVLSFQKRYQNELENRKINLVRIHSTYLYQKAQDENNLSLAKLENSLKIENARTTAEMNRLIFNSVPGEYLKNWQPGLDGIGSFPKTPDITAGIHPDSVIIPDGHFLRTCGYEQLCEVVR